MVSKGSDNSDILTIRAIKEYLSDYDIALRYLSLQNLPSLISSPFRQDTHSSFSIYMTNAGSVLYKDFGTGESGTLYELLAQLWGVTLSQAYQRIYDDINTHNLPKHTLSKGLSHSGTRQGSQSDIEVVAREWKKHDLDYWNSYGINKRWLEFGDIHPISQILISKNGKQAIIPAEKYAYVYVERKDNKVSLKIYQPYSTQYKWMSKHNSSVWDLWTRLPEKGDKLIITSSRKDALCLWANIGIPAIAMQGEGYMPKAKIIDELKQRFDLIYVLYDNDFTSSENHGRNYGKCISEKFSLIQIEIPDEYKTKDPSDTYKQYGKQKFQEIITNLLK